MLTPEELKAYASGWKRRSQEKQRKRDILRGEAMGRAYLVARLLREKYGVKRVILFGSLAEGMVRDGSDIDLVAEGLDMDRFIDIYWDASQLAHPFELDLVPLGSATGPLLRRIQKSGVEI